MKILRLTILIITLSLSTGCAIYHHYGPYYGKVIDAETKEPLEGAVVLADYNTWLYASPGGKVGYLLDAQEAVTDNKGEFKIPSLTKITFRPLSNFDEYPGFTIFKPQYECYRGSSRFTPNYSLPEDTYVLIELRKLKSKEERRKNIDCYPVYIPPQKMNKMVELNNIERSNLGLSPVYIKESDK